MKTLAAGLLAALAFAPVAASAQTIVLLADQSGRSADATFRSAASHAPDLVIQLGDWDHADPGLAATAAEAVGNAQAMRERTRTCVHPPEGNHAGCAWARYLSGFPLMTIWDDHDYCTDNSNRTCPWRRALIRAFKRAYPDGYPGAGVWRERIIRNVHVILLDVRSERDPFLQPEPRTMLGSEQKAWLADVLASSPAPWKLVVSPVTWNQTSGKSKDSWQAYPTARAEILPLLQSVPGVVVASGDMHSCGAIDDGTTAGVPEVNVPHSNMIVKTLLGQHGTWSNGIHDGVGCEGGYAVIEATASRLRVSTHFNSGGLSTTKLRLSR